MATRVKAKTSQKPKLNLNRGGFPILVCNGKIIDSGKESLLHIKRMIEFIENSGDWVHQAHFTFTILTEKK